MRCYQDHGIVFDDMSVGQDGIGKEHVGERTLTRNAVAASRHCSRTSTLFRVVNSMFVVTNTPHGSSSRQLGLACIDAFVIIGSHFLLLQGRGSITREHADKIMFEYVHWSTWRMIGAWRFGREQQARSEHCAPGPARHYSIQYSMHDLCDDLSSEQASDTVQCPVF